MYLLDSSICIDFLRGRLPYGYEVFKQIDPSLIKIPSIAAAELRTGAMKSSAPRRNSMNLENFMAPFEIIPFDNTCATAYAELRTELETHGKKIGQNDLMIAAMAVAHGAVLVTQDMKHFPRIQRLHMESWAETEL